MPAPNTKTCRQRLLDLLSAEQLGGLDLSQRLGIPEKEVYAHLEHVRRSAAARGLRFVLHPAACLSCGFVFKERRRVTRPGRCPACKGTHLRSPTYGIQRPGGSRGRKDEGIDD